MQLLTMIDRDTTCLVVTIPSLSLFFTQLMLPGISPNKDLPGPLSQSQLLRMLTKQRTRWPTVTVENLEGTGGDKGKGAVNAGFEHLSTHSCHPQFRPQPSCSWLFEEECPARFSKMLHKWQQYPATQRHKQRPLRGDFPTFCDQTPPSLFYPLQPANSNLSVLSASTLLSACWTLFSPSAPPLVHLCLGDTPQVPQCPLAPSHSTHPHRVPQCHLKLASLLLERHPLSGRKSVCPLGLTIALATLPDPSERVPPGACELGSCT